MMVSQDVCYVGTRNILIYLAPGKLKGRTNDAPLWVISGLFNRRGTEFVLTTTDAVANTCVEPQINLSF